MGQETVELPDPLLQRKSDSDDSSPTSAATADDLLAQLAGAEIDRLLADSDAPIDELAAEPDSSLVAAQADISQGTMAAVPQQTISDQLDAMFRTLAEKPEQESAAQEAAEATSTDPQPTAEELDEQIAREAQRLHSPSPPTNGQAAVLSALDAAPDLHIEAHEIESPLIPSADPPIASATSETALAVAIENDAVHASAVREALGSIDERSQRSERIPLLLMPLVWINAPFEALGPRVRDLLGKIAILTMLNALAVLIYVLVFKKH